VDMNVMTPSPINQFSIVIWGKNGEIVIEYSFLKNCVTFWWSFTKKIIGHNLIFCPLSQKKNYYKNNVLFVKGGMSLINTWTSQKNRFGGKRNLMVTHNLTKQTYPMTSLYQQYKHFCIFVHVKMTFIIIWRKVHCTFIKENHWMSGNNIINIFLYM